MQNLVSYSREDRFLNWAAYAVLAGVAVAGIVEIDKVYQRWMAVPALIAIAVLYNRTPGIGVQSNQRAAHLLLGTQTALVAYLLTLDPDSPGFPILFFILSSLAMRLLPLSAALLWVGLFALITGGILYWDGGWAAVLSTWLPYAGGYLFFGLFSTALVRARLAQNETQSVLFDLQQANRRLQEYASQVETLAVIEERTRLAREMHDTIGHRLTVSAVQLEGAQRLATSDPERAERMIATVREQVREALSELRQSVAVLRQPVELDLSLEMAVRRLGEAFQQATGTSLEVQIDELPALPDPHRLALYRAAQEALTNIQRHAQAQHAWLKLSAVEQRLEMVVEDDGVGCNLAQETTSSPAGDQPVGFGLLGLQERAAQLRGECRVENREAGGCQLTFWLPYPVEEPHE